MSAALADPGAAFYDRASKDATMKTLLGLRATGSGRANWLEEWPDDKTSEASFPRGTFGAPVLDRDSEAVSKDVVEVNIWVWPTGANGGKQRLKDIDDRLTELFDQVRWAFGTARIYSHFIGGGDHPAPPGRPLRRRRRIRFIVS